jgi:hypothetical protein
MIETIVPNLTTTDKQCLQSDVPNLPTVGIAAGTTCNVMADDGVSGLVEVLVFQNGQWVKFA